MKWVVVAAVVSTLAAGALAFAAMLDVSSAKLTVFTNTLTSPTIDLSLSSTGIDVGGSATASSTLNGASADADGTVTYTVYSDSGCSLGPISAGTKDVMNAVVPDSDPVTFNVAGSYYWRASYSGDGNNQPAVSSCVELVVESP
jgi:hypothetical protein